MTVRAAVEGDVPALARMWHEGWHDGHAAHVPDALTRLRTLDDFTRRLREMLEDTRVSGPEGAPTGFFMLRGAEVYQFYVAREARGSGAADALMADAEAQLAMRGTARAHLDVNPHNARAIAFYRRAGWQAGAVRDVAVDTCEGPFPVACLEMTKRVAPVM
ncbi:GNAT family N-acetyltransferase [Anianabacter salinae]|uniref:GNAT family N-acetyltransferase n=1 Tax=Anianabacter salinae TaxID=2851023 RepID=UPI00225DDAA7|nr:GNAT family N-acetyltransferase [Anianabacter salinae]